MFVVPVDLYLILIFCGEALSRGLEALARQPPLFGGPHVLDTPHVLRLIPEQPQFEPSYEAVETAIGGPLNGNRLVDLMWDGKNGQCSRQMFLSVACGWTARSILAEPTQELPRQLERILLRGPTKLRRYIRTSELCLGQNFSTHDQ